MRGVTGGDTHSFSEDEPSSEDGDDFGRDSQCMPDSSKADKERRVERVLAIRV